MPPLPKPTPPSTCDFSQLPHEVRFPIIRTVSDLGGAWTYTGRYLLVSLSRPTADATRRFLKAHGLVCDAMACHFFPLGSDNPPEDLRWSCWPYPGRGFWYREGWYVPAGWRHPDPSPVTAQEEADAQTETPDR